MSGEVVVVNTVCMATINMTLIFGGLIVVGGVAYQMAKAHQEQRLVDAKNKAFKQKRQLKVWQDYQATQQQVMEGLNEGRQMARDAFASLSLHLEEDNSQQDDSPPEVGAQAQSFLDADENSQVQQKLEQLQLWLAQLPPQLSDHEASPISRLQSQLEQFTNQLPQLETVENFVETAKRSVSQLIQNLDEQRQQQAQVLQQAELQLDELLNYQQFAEAGIEAEEVTALQTHLLAILEQQTTTVSLNALAVLQKKSATLKQRIDQRLEQQAAEVAINQRVNQRMEEMGYLATQQQGERVQSWTIPGGEQVRFSLQPDFKMSFQVAHERTQQTDAALSLRETAFLHQQEHKWCKDLPKLIKKLQEDGLNYEVDFERQLPDDAIPIVILETVDELLAAEEEEAARLQQQNSVKRYLDK